MLPAVAAGGPFSAFKQSMGKYLPNASLPHGLPVMATVNSPLSLVDCVGCLLGDMLDDPGNPFCSWTTSLGLMDHLRSLENRLEPVPCTETGWNKQPQATSPCPKFLFRIISFQLRPDFFGLPNGKKCPHFPMPIVSCGEI